MPLTKSQIAQRKNSKIDLKICLQTNLKKKNKASDSSNSDFILSDEIYSSDSDVDIIHIDAEVAIKQGKVGRVCSEKYSSHRRERSAT
ncbi:5210_t:CDS:2 [Entrophospora sp. SA101]|nr:3814_t:CDS:2 [Entrophospora sp. SA101]CAJ0834428.1 5210_t:CDS:2 [Entrophospora sp. SA101]